VVPGRELFELFHYFRPDQVLGRNHIVQVKPERLFQNMPLRLPIPLGNRHELIVELGVDLRSELLGCCGRHGWHLPI